MRGSSVDQAANVCVQETGRININDDRDIRFWCEALKCTPEFLRKAVASMGPMLKDVKRYLGIKN